MNQTMIVLPKGTELHNGRRKYKVEEVLGTGGFGITYKVSSTVMVENVAANIFFAMKEYFPSSCYRDKDDVTMMFSPTMQTEVEQSLNDFITEARRLNALGHKSDNIVKVNEVFKENGTAYYIMEYLEGGNLHEYVQKRGALSEAEALAFLTPIARAVEAIHAERILHLDIKPENIVLKKDPDTGNTTPVLIDFGLVKHFDAKGKPTTRLAAKGASDGYAPIEQYTVIDSFSPTLDVYALGATLYYLLKGENPPTAFNIESSAVIGNSLPTTVSEKTRQTIVGAMAKSKFERTPSVSQFLAALKSREDVKKETIKEEPVVTREPATKTARLGQEQPTKSKKKLWYITAAACILLVGGFFLAKNLMDKKRGEENYAIAKQYLEKKDTVAAIPYLEKSIDYGHPTAMAEMGECYLCGDGGMPKDTIKAFQLFELAVAKGDAMGQERLGVCYQYGYGTEKDSLKAYQLYEQSALQGHGEGMLNLGRCYEKGIGVRKDSVAAFNWYLQSAESGNAYGMDFLGGCYLRGIGVKPDTIKAFNWYKKSAELGNVNGQANLGWCYRYGYGVQKDPIEAIKWYEKSASQGDVWAMKRLALTYYYGWDVKKDEKEAFKWYMKLAKLNDSESMYYVGLCYYEGTGVEMDKEVAYNWYLKSAQKGYDDAQNALGDIFDEKKDYGEAFKWYNMAAEQNHMGALCQLGFYYFFSKGVKGDSTKAVYYWEESMKPHGEGEIQIQYQNTAAMYNLGLCYEYGWGVQKNPKKSKYWYNRERGIESDSTSVSPKR